MLLSLTSQLVISYDGISSEVGSSSTAMPAIDDKMPSTPTTPAGHQAVPEKVIKVKRKLYTIFKKTYLGLGEGFPNSTTESRYHTHFLLSQ